MWIPLVTLLHAFAASSVKTVERHHGFKCLEEVYLIFPIWNVCSNPTKAELTFMICSQLIYLTITYHFVTSKDGNFLVNFHVLIMKALLCLVSLWYFNLIISWTLVVLLQWSKLISSYGYQMVK